MVSLGAVSAHSASTIKLGLPDLYPQSIGLMLARTRMGRIRPAPKISTSDYIGTDRTGDSHNPTSSQSHRPIYFYGLPGIPDGNRTDKLQVRVYTRVG